MSWNPPMTIPERMEGDKLILVKKEWRARWFGAEERRVSVYRLAFFDVRQSGPRSLKNG